MCALQLCKKKVVFLLLVDDVDKSFSLEEVMMMSETQFYRH